MNEIKGTRKNPNRKIAIITFLLLIVLIMAKILTWALSVPLRVKESSEKIVLDFQNLGEYNSSLREIEITNSKNETIWKAIPKDEFIAIWTLEIKKGENPICLNLDSASCSKLQINTKNMRNAFFESGDYKICATETGNVELFNKSVENFKM